jgi:hypothetical protein
MAGEGGAVVEVHLSPPYLGLGATPDEIIPEDRRAPIRWESENGTMVGHANPWAPREYGYVLYFWAPFGPPCFAAQIDQPQTQPTEGRVTVGPILMANGFITAQL